MYGLFPPNSACARGVLTSSEQAPESDLPQQRHRTMLAIRQPAASLPPACRRPVCRQSRQPAQPAQAACPASPASRPAQPASGSACYRASLSSPGAIATEHRLPHMPGEVDRKRGNLLFASDKKHLQDVHWQNQKPLAIPVCSCSSTSCPAPMP